MDGLFKQTADVIFEKVSLNTIGINLIAQCLFGLIVDLIINNRPFFHGMAGISRFSDLIVNEIVSIASKPRNFRVIPLNKKKIQNQHKIIPVSDFTYPSSEKVLLIDYLTIGADEKLTAIKVVESVGQKVVGLITLINNEQGDKERIEQAGYFVHSVFRMSQLVDYYLEIGKISEKEHQKYMNYIKK
ncbi:hypothetical protein KAI92_03130 [Candidatus Parcubacteria bacterium]|nr:hypothetical protein [Candidatus Parcubacteria bacterium]